MDEKQPDPNLPTDLSQSSTVIQSATNQVSQSIKRKPRNYDQKVHGKRLGLPARVAVMAMKDSGMTATEIARASKVAVSTIVRCWDNPLLAELSPQAVQKTKTGLGGLFYRRALEATIAIDDDKLAASSALQLATVAGIMTEKGRLMDGLSTENVSFRGVAENLEADRAKLMAKFGDDQE